MGIINGTTNYILTKMSNDGASYEEVLKEAQKLGYETSAILEAILCSSIPSESARSLRSSRTLSTTMSTPWIFL